MSRITARSELEEAIRRADILASALEASSSSPALLFDGDGRLVWMARWAESLLSTRLGRGNALDRPFQAPVRGLLALQSASEIPRTITIEVPVGRPGANLRAGLFYERALQSGEPLVV